MIINDCCMFDLDDSKGLGEIAIYEDDSSLQLSVSLVKRMFEARSQGATLQDLRIGFGLQFNDTKLVRLLERYRKDCMIDKGHAITGYKIT